MGRPPLGGSLLFSLLVAALIPTAATAATPPAASPLLAGAHPRLFFTNADLPGIRARIAQHYPTQFQNFIDLLDNTAVLTAGQRGIEEHWGAVNYAFIAALDPAQMAQLGFVFQAPLNTPQAYCGKAMTYATQLLPSVTAGIVQNHGWLQEGYPQWYYPAVMLTYDWCYPYLSQTDKAAIVDALVAAYTKRYAGKNLMTVQVDCCQMLANNWGAGAAHDALGILAFYGDSYPSATLQADMYNAFHAVWIDRILMELSYFYGDGTNWHEGPGGYFNEGYVNLAVPVEMFSSAVGTDYAATMPFFSTAPVFQVANTVPHSRLAQCGTGGTASCPLYRTRYGDIAYGIADTQCKSAILNSGALRRAGHRNAGLAKWLYSVATGSCGSTITKYGGTWAHAVLYWFILGDAEVAPETPAQNGMSPIQKLGLGQYVFNTGFGPSDSQVVFWAMPYRMYGHGTHNFGHFTIHKYGDLILEAGNAKSGDARLSGDGFNLMQNIVGLHKGGNDPTVASNGSVPDPLFGVGRGITDTPLAGTVRAEFTALGGFNYVSYDWSVAWDPATAQSVNREFVYLRGAPDAEFVVVLDRMRATNAAAQKIWKVWVPTQPRFVDGVATTPRAGKWTSTNTTLLEITNEQTNLLTPNFESAPTHGRLFLKALSPSGAVINALGGPGAEYQSGNDDGTTPWGAPAMTDAMRAYLGWGRIEIRPAVQQNYDTFLTVMQFGDSRTLQSMSPVTRLTTTDTKMSGTHVMNANNQWVVLFAQQASDVLTLTGATYTFQPVVTTSSHLLVNMAPSQTYYVTTSSASSTTVTVTQTPQPGAITVQSNAEGILAFVLNGLTVVAPVAPAPPTNVHVSN